MQPFHQPDRAESTRIQLGHWPSRSRVIYNKIFSVQHIVYLHISGSQLMGNQVVIQSEFCRMITSHVVMMIRSAGRVKRTYTACLVEYPEVSCILFYLQVCSIRNKYRFKYILIYIIFMCKVTCTNTQEVYEV